MNKKLEEQFKLFYRAYPRHESRGEAETRFEQIMKVEEDPVALTKKMVLALAAQKKHRNTMIKSGQWMPREKLPAPWLNKKCWLDEIPSSMDVAEKTESKKCTTMNCFQDSHYVDGLCTEHLYEKHDTMKLHRKAVMTKLGLLPKPNESKTDWAMRCRASMGSMNGLCRSEA